MIRLDKDGRDVTELPGLWSDDDCEIVETNRSHPSVTSGQHTNGRAMLWIRRAGVGEWVRTGLTHMHLLRGIWIECGEECFETWEAK